MLAPGLMRHAWGEPTDTSCVVPGRVTRCADGAPVAVARVRIQLLSGGFKQHEEHETRSTDVEVPFCLRPE